MSHLKIVTLNFHKYRLWESCFPDFWKVSFVVPLFQKVGERSMAKIYRPLSLISVVSKIFEKFINNRLADHFRNMALFLISTKVSGLLDQLQIFWQLHLIELLGLLIGLELWHLIYLRLSAGCSKLAYFTNLNLMEFQVKYLTLFRVFSVIDGFRRFWMGSICRVSK